jgi:hypothetical protein
VELAGPSAQRRDEITCCYEKQLLGHPDLGGQILPSRAS